MKPTTTRNLLVAAFVLNLVFFGLMMMDFMNWGGRNWAPIATAWVLVLLLSFSLGLFTRGQERPVERVVERLVIWRPDGTYAAIDNGPAPAAPPASPAPNPTATAVEGPFQYNGYTLHSREVEFKNGAKRVIYFFAKHKPKSGAPIAKPSGYHVGVNQKTGLPFLKGGEGIDGADLTPTIEVAYRPQCGALTDAGHQCRNSARGGSKYCASHFGYQPPMIAKAAAVREDTLPRVPEAKDTVPSVRRKLA